MNVQQPGCGMGVFLGGAGVGAIAGLVPLFLGVRKNRTWLAVGGFLASVAGGMAAGLIGAAILAGCFSLAMRPWDEPAAEAIGMPVGGSKGRSALGWYLIVMFFVQTVIMAVFWSLFMSVWLGRSFVSILVPAGASFGLTMGIVFTVLMAVLLRAGTVRVRVFDRAEFLDRLDRAAGKLRYRPLPRSDGTIAYEPRALVRTAATRIHVDLGEAEAVMTGPKLTLERLKNEIEPPRR